MSGFSRMKRVTDPLDDKVKAQIIGRDIQELHYFSSGSEHSAHTDDDDITSPSFSDLIFRYQDDEFNQNDQSLENDHSDSELDVSMCKSVDYVEDTPKLIYNTDFDLFRTVLVSCVTKALEIYSCSNLNKSILHRNVMTCLRNYGYNAAVCKTKWESCGGLNAGNYEFIDVIKLDSSNKITTRYFIDLEFSAEFEIARATSQYEKLLNSLPKVFVGKSEELKKILQVMSNAMRRSLRTRELSISPWRKNRFMQNKWLGPYRRTSNVMPSVNSPMNGVKCRTVGFHAAAVNGCLLFPATTRSR